METGGKFWQEQAALLDHVRAVLWSTQGHALLVQAVLAEEAKARGAAVEEAQDFLAEFVAEVMET